MGLGGAAYITILSEFYTIGMKSAPKWIGARVLAIYLLILNGGLVVGSLIWDTNSQHIWYLIYAVSILIIFRCNYYCQKTL